MKTPFGITKDVDVCAVCAYEASCPKNVYDYCRKCLKPTQHFITIETPVEEKVF